MPTADESRPSPDSDLDADFAAAWAIADTIPGWLKIGQARLLFENARALGPGARVLEIGSHQGRSTVLLAKALEPLGGSVLCVDPFVEGKLFGGTPTRTKFENNIAAAGVGHLVELHAEYSTELRPRWTEDFDLLYIDGKHDYWTLSDDLLWAAHLPVGGPVLIHDCYSSIGVTLGILAHVLPSRVLRYQVRSDSMALFFKGSPSTSDRLRILGEMPWWIRNVLIKVLLRLRLRPVARAFGHDSPYDPY
ncbi:MAG: class I SAM-dependent methyltransferase [Propionibacteriales bacterium]|nr:class I SAM-dependent methyltransferase [Propionibacteriales bacterium]